jgi:hypothetical protein
MVQHIAVDTTNARRCDLQCAQPDRHGTLCRDNPQCVAVFPQDAEAQFDRDRTSDAVTHEARGRSHQGGYSQNRIFVNPADGTTIEEVELHCQTQKFAALVAKQPGPKR